MAKVAFLGLGVMGYPMAGHLQAAGHQVTVYNRTAEKADKWVTEHGGDKANTPADAARGCEFIFACVGDDADIRSVTTGPDGAFQTMDAGAVFVDNTTASADVARELYAAARAAGLHFIDAPVSGGQAGAEGGKLTVMCGGDDAAYNRAEPLMGCYGARVTHMGAAGAGQLTKMVNQICIAGLVQGLSEALNFGQNAGLDMDKVLGVVSGGAAQSWQMENRGTTMVRDEFDFGFAVDWMRKDLRICLAEATQNGSQLPVTALVAQFYAALSERGFGRNDTSSLIRLLKN
ncbi:beta-hydroxyacid dehydrogenase, 3-hydroxyisobutyrate dehydrogenase [SAR116 cluster alpha proteobacterium HIMB100]|nr:beta-hydroxyacid dehydrogenase, 3-hydroxyisobutyrate dehydrogenase [SAR116 cluster alpha proteobacterium HIMB100]